MEYDIFNPPEEKPYDKYKINLYEYDINKYINYGRVGYYHICFRNQSKQYFLLKVYQKSKILKNNEYEKYLKELQFYIDFQSNKFFPLFKGINTDNPKYLSFLFEFMPGGTLKNLLSMKKNFKTEESKFYLLNIIKIFEYLHDNYIIYRDIKPENIFIRKNGYVTILDFSLCKKLNLLHNLSTKTICNKPNYVAPEMILNKYYSFKVDSWMLGVFFYEMIIGKDPFYNKDTYLIYQNILKCNVKFPKNIEKEVKNLINCMLNVNVDKRFGLNEIKAHKLFIDFKWNLFDNQILHAPFVPSDDINPLFYFNNDKNNKKIFEKWEKMKEEKNKLNENDENFKFKFAEVEIINDDEEPESIEKSEDPFLNW